MSMQNKIQQSFYHLSQRQKNIREPQKLWNLIFLQRFPPYCINWPKLSQLSLHKCIITVKKNIVYFNSFFPYCQGFANAATNLCHPKHALWSSSLLFAILQCFGCRFFKVVEFLSHGKFWGWKQLFSS